MEEGKITKLDKPTDEAMLYNILNPLVKQWFKKKFPSFALPQAYGVMPIHSRENILISSPTGSGKTLTAFLAILNELVDSAEKGILENRVYAIYISPLKALGTDIKHNLIEPLAEIQDIAYQDLGIRVATRTGDTTAYEKQKLLKKPPHILITTPESLALMLASPKFKEHLKGIEWAILDEIHAMAENKRGVHLSLFLEHLQYHNPGLCRVGLSATVSPIEDVARFLAGTNRDCKYVDISYIKELDLKVISPVKDLVNTDIKEINKKTYEKLHELIKSHKTTLVFTNTRAGTERVVHTLKDKFPKDYYEQSDNKKLKKIRKEKYWEETDENIEVSKKENAKKLLIEEKIISEKLEQGMSLIGAHHGSLSKDHRFDIEQKLRDGKLKAVVCSTSLELGIDIGSIDLVILLGSPKAVSRALQRSGRAGHQLHSVTKARIIVTDRDDLIECSVLLKNALEHRIDRIHIPQNSYDVLVQHVLGFALNSEVTVDELYKITQKSYCYRNLELNDFLEVIRYLSGSFQSLENRYIFAKIVVYEDNIIRPRGKMTRVIYTSNLGTIPSSGGVLVKAGDYPLGMIDEGFLEKLKPGDTFVLGGEVYQYKFSRGMVAQVSAAYNKAPTVPRWVSETLPLSFDLANSIQKFRGQIFNHIKTQKKSEVLKWINEYVYVDDSAAEAIYNYMIEEYNFTKEFFPRDTNFSTEIFYDEIFRTKKHYHIFHSLNGRKVNESLSRVFAFALGKFHHKDIEIGVNDNGFYLAANIRLDIRRIFDQLEPENFRNVLKEAIENSESLRRRFRHCAERSFMILRNYKGNIRRAGRQQVSSMILLKAAKKISKDFIILQEAMREVIEDSMDVDNATIVYNNIKRGTQKIVISETNIPSPFATNLILQGYSDIITVEDRHSFLQTMHKLVQAKISNKNIVNEEPFSYERFWKKKEKIIEIDLRKQFLIAFRKLKTPAYICEEILHCLENRDKKLSDNAEEYYKEEFSGVVNKFWTDDIIKFVKLRY